MWKLPTTCIYGMPPTKINEKERWQDIYNDSNRVGVCAEGEMEGGKECGT